LILAGDVFVGEELADKPGRQVREDVPVKLRERLPYVSRGGLKLAAALDAFAIHPQDWVCADVGASTGGFTDCLLQRGAARVYAIDVGYGQLAWSLREDPRVISLERVNIRYLERLPEPVHLATVDVSFIGLGLVLPRVTQLLDDGGQIIALIKPQFEAGKGQVGKGGVVRDPALHRAAIEKVLAEAAACGLAPAGLLRSPVTGPAGNVEFLAWLRPAASAPGDFRPVDWPDGQVPTVSS
jgi:23S rRNA (cytidine1920-2'-O)/16S rRNA (cytidine1409-2'-O)-methyltransferase